MRGALPSESPPATSQGTEADSVNYARIGDVQGVPTSSRSRVGLRPRHLLCHSEASHAVQALRLRLLLSGQSNAQPGEEMIRISWDPPLWARSRHEGMQPWVGALGPPVPADEEWGDVTA